MVESPTPLRTHQIPAPLMTDLINYLSTKPWAEVHPMMQQLFQVLQNAASPPVKKAEG
jgi:hypothetical protein